MHCGVTRVCRVCHAGGETAYDEGEKKEDFRKEEMRRGMPGSRELAGCSISPFDISDTNPFLLGRGQETSPTV